MRSFPRLASAAVLDRLAALFERAEAVSGELSPDGALDALGRAARLEALFRSRYAALASPAVVSSPTALPEGPRYLNAAAAGEYLGVSKSTMLRLAKAGTIRACRPSKGIVRFDRADLDAYMAGTTRRRGHQAPGRASV